MKHEMVMLSLHARLVNWFLYLIFLPSQQIGLTSILTIDRISFSRILMAVNASVRRGLKVMASKLVKVRDFLLAGFFSYT